MKQKNREKMIKAISTVMLFTLLLFSNVQVVHAVGLGKRAADTLADELVWVALGITAVVALTAFARKAYIQAGVAAIVGGIVSYFIANLEKIKVIGESIGNTILP